MNRKLKLCFALAGIASAPLLLANPSATDPAATVPAVTYRSAFDGYQAFREQPTADWRAVNDEVARVGGHVGIVGGAAGHAGHAAPKGPADTGQPPVRSAPKAPATKDTHH